MKKLKNMRSVLLGAAIVSMSLFLLAGCAAKTPQQSGQSAATNNGQQSSSAAQNSATAVGQTTGVDTDGDGIPDSIEKTYGTNFLAADTDGDGVTDKTDKDPLFTPNLIKETSTTALPVKVKDARVEDNVNANDHLEIALTNTGKTDLKNFDTYFTVTDTVTKKQEGYYVKMNGFTLEAGATKTLHFDNKKGDLHYNGNANGIYGTSKNEVLFQGQIHATGYAPIDFSAKKSKGTAEVKD
ncbi:hypothetical protein UF75_0283 [Desulfosporosinus sp. I2]|uniref:thrombospondin type 3 repeat-containing protein n=1 Tax=Desulfosporosinus sp. I2 TaxID=1617025 RepID=UPI00061FEF04|nr:thrombospondin type 3 repeat-containing protein [Desulfosporosinus sp. I2]KJR49443.1 hypothetical protein UF75_0283 [Desulfosporosinus sp. I2]